MGQKQPRGNNSARPELLLCFVYLLTPLSEIILLIASFLFTMCPPHSNTHIHTRAHVHTHTHTHYGILGLLRA